mgnify:CR=1 FL=1
MIISAMVSFVEKLGRGTIGFFRTLGRSGFMLYGALVGMPQPKKYFPLFVKQLYVLGVQSLLIILLSGLFIGLVLGLQGYSSPHRFHSHSQNPLGRLCFDKSSSDHKGCL